MAIVLSFQYISRLCAAIRKHVKDTEPELTTVGNIGVSTLEDGKDTDSPELTAVGDVVSTTISRTLEDEDVTDANLTTLGINNIQIVVDKAEITPPNKCSPADDEPPIVPQQTAYFYTQPGIP